MFNQNTFYLFQGGYAARERTTDTVRVQDDSAKDVLTEILRQGAHQLLATAIESEVDTDLAEDADQRDANGHRLLDDRVPTGSVCGAALANSHGSKLLADVIRRVQFVDGEKMEAA